LEKEIMTTRSPEELSLFREVKCPVCAGQSIEDSTTDEAVFLRDYIGEKLNAGMTPSDIRTELRQEFGDDILFAPPLNGHTALLWGGPGIMVLGIILFIFRRVIKNTPEGVSVRP